MAGINKKRYRVRARAPYSPSEFRSYARDVLFLPWFSNFKKIPSLRRKAWLIIFNECVIKIIYGSWKKGLDERSAMTYWAWDNLCPCTINRGEEMKSSWSDAIASCDTRESRHFANHAPLGNRVCGLQSKLFSARHENSLCTERTLRRPPPSLERKSLLRPVFVPPFFLIERSGEKEEGKKRGEEGKEEREKSSSITRFDSIESKKRRRRIDGIPTPIASNPNLWQGRKLKRIRRIRFASVHADGTTGSRCTRLGNPFSTCNFKRNTKRYGSLRRAL